MRILFDTSFLVGLDRKKESCVDFMKKFTNDKNEFFISIISVTEILTGAYLQDKEKQKQKLNTAKELLMQFNWIDYDGEIADRGAKIIAQRIRTGNIVDFQDNIILSTFTVNNFDYLVTTNKKHFNLRKNKIISPEELIAENEQNRTA
ncbi:PIN domain-containing protein [Candidatus Woesearchaeota archaeon]|nr:PIN domain-containing protein [Candidatus Woesearchaeota archaeon]